MSNFDGIILVDKPINVSSNQIIRKIKKLYKIKKIGHTGTLDPFASGLLLCCINKATKLFSYFLKCKKKYKGIIRLGIDTDTHDITGNITKKKTCNEISINEIYSTTKIFKGYINQYPPFFSALKHNGNPLYKLAKNGVYIKKPSRQISIKKLIIEDIKFPDIFFEIECSAGTYIRTLCSDIGRTLGCSAHLKSLYRVSIGNFSVDKSYKFKNLNFTTLCDKINTYIIPINKITNFIPLYVIKKHIPYL